MTNEIQHALDFRDLGWSVFPVHSIIDSKCTCGNDKCGSPGKHPATRHGLKDATTAENHIRAWFKNGNRNVAIVTGEASNLLVVDIDPRHGGDDEWDDLIKEHGEITTLSVKTGGGGFHYYFNYPDDRTIRNSANLRPGIDIRGEGGYVVAPPSMHKSGNPYAFDIEDELSLSLISDIPEWLLNVIQRGTNVNSNDNRQSVTSTPSSIPSGSRNSAMFKLACYLKKSPLSPEALQAALYRQNETRCDPPLQNDEVRSIIKSASNYSAPLSVLKPIIGDEAIAGPLGRIAQKLSTYTEAPVMTIYFHLVIAFGNLIGKRAIVINGPIEHHSVLFGLVIGRTAKGRKGTSWDMAKLVLEQIDSNWLDTCYTSGLSSGEGLAFTLKSQLETNEERLLIVEAEFSQVLKQKQRSGNTLSESLRNMWDGNPIKKMTISNPISVENYHLSLIAHITPKEFRDLVGSTEFSNGFLNRFLFCLSEKTQSIPLAKELPKNLFASEIHLLRAVIEKLLLSPSNRFCLTEGAKEVYRSFYHQLDNTEDSEESELEDVSARGPSHVFRLSLVSALQNGHSEIKEQDMKAAIAIWEYSVQSIEYVISKKKASAELTKLFQAILQEKQGLTRTQCNKVFNNHKSKAELDQLIDQLFSQNKIERRLQGAGKERCEFYKALGEREN